jgi:hypothetical protein
MLDDTLAYFKRKIEPTKGGVAQLKVLDNPQSVQVVIEEQTVLAHGGVERFLAGMPKGRVADVVDQRKGFDQIYVQVELPCDRARDLCHFQCMGQAIAEMVGEAPGKNLGFGFQAAKSPRMNHTVAVPLKVVSIGMLSLRNAASAGVLHPDSVIGQHQ